jgi:hypothetical protein
MDAIILSNGAEGDVPGIIHRYIGPYKLAHFVRKHGHTIQIIDHVARMEPNQLIASINRFITPSTKILGLSATFISQRMHQWPDGQKHLLPYHVYLAMRVIKSHYPLIHVIIGGFNSNWLPDWGIVDSSIKEYAEDIFLDLLEHLKLGTPAPVGIRETVSSRISWKKPNQVRYNIECDDFRFTEHDAILPKETLPLEVSRGCIFSCKFCNHPLLGRKKLDYLRSMEMIKQELLYNHEKWQTTSYVIICDTFNDTMIKMQAWHEMVMSLPFKIRYAAFLRADLLQSMPDVPIMLQESGLVSTYHGIESLGLEASMAVGKGWSGKHARTYIPHLYHDIWKGQIRQQVGFIAGLPGDTKEDILTWADWFMENDLYHIGIAPLWLAKDMLSPSRLSFELEKHGYTFPDDDRTVWHLPNWHRKDAIKFVADEFKPRLEQLGKDLTCSPWDVANLMGRGHNHEFFDKNNLRSIGRTEYSKMTNNIASSYMKTYTTLLNSVA